MTTQALTTPSPGSEMWLLGGEGVGGCAGGGNWKATGQGSDFFFGGEVGEGVRLWPIGQGSDIFFEMRRVCLQEKKFRSFLMVRVGRSHKKRNPYQF